MNGIIRQQGRSDSPQRNDLNSHVMAQLNSQINNIDINDLPPPPPIPQVRRNFYNFRPKIKKKESFINFLTNSC